MGHQRAHERLPISGAVTLYWEDDAGQAQYCRAEARDASATGLSVTIRQRMPLRAIVQVECLSNQVKGTVVVRRCEQRGLNFVVGLEFTGGGRQTTKMRYS